MEQTKALNALEPFLALSKSATSPRAAADLINRATSAPGTYAFTELLSTPNIAALASSPEPEFRAWHTHLELFSHGLYEGYAADGTLPPLSPAQQLKLRQLSLLTLSRDKARLTYPALMRSLGLATPRDLEDLVIGAVYAGLLSARLNPARREVQVNNVAPLRDVRPASVAGIVTTLQEWSARCDATLAELEASVSAIRAEAARAVTRRREDERVVAVAVAAEEKASAAGGASLAPEGGSGAGSRHRSRKTHGHSAVANLRSQINASGPLGSSAGGGGAKRSSEKLMESTAGADDDDEAMDLDDDAEGPGQGRASRRRL
ncbi:hypothetical protein M406DRAFT_322708 [Cryphonectria parasitica EP155]|uniref:PCI domain-containing protein n=1 Tax=Cryphonectria parasitica (strain ATCC 38755 / EP155) TaxID=660469 RepID=A0A9P4Y0H5_CRYP1|nr:uncharacterized protein M406DRAFT_322708 [Cryphonectria parasitica EP155]KAF3764739.1 hypothetical protein M406DRAFT_322708 [Cryphonectria parasitica EP155]